MEFDLILIFGIGLNIIIFFLIFGDASLNDQLLFRKQVLLRALLVNYDWQTDRPTVQLTNEPTDRLIGKLHFQYSKGHN